MQCCCCGKEFRGIKSKMANGTREDGTCPKCKQVVGELKFVSLYGNNVTSRFVNINGRSEIKNA